MVYHECLLLVSNLLPSKTESERPIKAQVNQSIKINQKHKCVRRLNKYELLSILLIAYFNILYFNKNMSSVLPYSFSFLRVTTLTT